VDLHEQFSELRDRSVAELFARSRLAPMGDVDIRVLGVEDHLALLAIHLLKHGAWRAIWLCDIGAAVECLPAEFDWNLCLGRNPTRASWIVSAIGLANRLLGARIDDLPIATEAKKLPAWLIESVLEQWANPFPVAQAPYSHPIPFEYYLKRPKGVLTGLSKRWPNPIKATVSVNGRFNGFPRLPYQVGNCLLRAAQFFSRYTGSFSI
jgi:hypothetical protein